MLENAVYSILSPEGFASILYKDAGRAQEAAENMKITAQDLMKLGIIDKIIEEPDDGVQAHQAGFESVASDLKKYIIESVNKLKFDSKNDIEILVENRYKKFRKVYR